MNRTKPFSLLSFFCFLNILLTGCTPNYSIISMPSIEFNYLSDYNVQILDADITDSITIKQTENGFNTDFFADNSKIFILIEVKIRRNNVIDSSKNHALDKDDFKLKDHKGISLQTYSFPTVESIEDFNWVGSEIIPNEELLLQIAFQIPNNISFTNSKMVLEIDFFVAPGGLDIELNK